MEERRYSFRSANNVDSPVISERELFDTVRTRQINPDTTVQEIGSGQRFRAGDNPAIAAIFRQMGIDPSPPSPPIVLKGQYNHLPGQTLPGPVLSTEEMSRGKFLGVGLAGFFGLLVVSVVLSVTCQPNTNTGNDPVAAWGMGKQFVTENLKSPTSARFPWYEKEFVTKIDDNTYQINSYVDAQNSFGATLRSNWSCRVRFVGGGKWVCEDVQIVSP